MANNNTTSIVATTQTPHKMNTPNVADSTVLLLGHTGSWWDFWMVLSLGGVALAGFLVVVFTAGSILVHKREAAAASDALERYKLETKGKVADATSAGIAAGKTAGDAFLRAAALEKEAQELKAANLALKAKIQPRRLSGEESKKLSAAISGLHSLAIGVVSRIFDPEGADFADDLANAFNKGNWQAVRLRNWTMSDRGVALATLEGTVIPSDLATALTDALATAGVQATIITIPKDKQNTLDPHFQDNVLYLLVGAKPE